MTIEEFKKTRDYKDILYMVKHVPYLSTRCDILRELGYCVTVSKIPDLLSRTGDITLVKWNIIKMQISGRLNDGKYAWFVMLKYNN